MHQTAHTVIRAATTDRQEVITMTYTNAELLAPAGSPEALDAAIGEGADAVYLGLKTFNARMRTANFAYSQFEAAVESLHKMGKRLYVTVNTVFEQREADRMYQLLQYLDKVGPDGIIVQDLGVLKLATDNFPGLRIHASTQMNVASAAGANFLSRFGVKRVVLSRELSLAEIRAVRSGTNMELETFVHGALCVSASGLCLFSSYLGGRSANRGACTQACRRLFREESRDGYFFSPDDLQLVERIPELIDAGVSALKIEGRMKSAEYVGSVVAAYRYMLDNWRFDRERAALKAAAILQGDFARNKTTFWFDGTVDPDFIRPDQAGGTGIPLGKVRVVRVFDDKRWMLLRSHDGIAEGDSIRIHRHDDSGRLTTRVRAVMEKAEGLYLQADVEFGPEDTVYLVQTRTMSRRYRSVLPTSLAKYHKFPSYDPAPRPEFPAIPKERLAALPEGLYAMVSRVQDLHTILADRPEKAILRLDRKNAELLRRHEKETPFKRESLILWLEPFFPQADVDWLSEELQWWLEHGQKVFIANNLGHLALLKGRSATVIAGPWLYAFNAWAAGFFLSNGADYIVPPLEISKQNFGRVAEFIPDKCIMPMVFAYPPLFTIRADLGGKYDFRYIRDREGGDYELVTAPDGSVVIPAKPYSLVDRIPFMRRDGMNKFILDFSFMDLKKQVYKRVMAAARDAVVLQDTGRFNWKDGFWNPEESGPAAPVGSSPGSSFGGSSGTATGPGGSGASKAPAGRRSGTNRSNAGHRTSSSLPNADSGNRARRGRAGGMGRGSSDQTPHGSGDRPARSPGDRAARSSVDRAARGSGDRASRSPGDRASRSPGDRAARGSVDRAARSPGDRASRSPGDRAARGSVDRAARSPGDRATRSPGDRAARSSGDRADRSPGDRVGRSPGDRAGRSPGDRAARGSVDRVGRSPGDRPGTSERPGRPGRSGRSDKIGKPDRPGRTRQ
jgi:putative protease